MQAHSCSVYLNAFLSSFSIPNNFFLTKNYSLFKTVLATMMESKLKRVEVWLRKSGMKVNEAKTCLCLFYHKDSTPIEITLNNVKIKSVTKINVLGVIFDQRLQWSDHISHCTKKSSKALCAIRLISKFFNTQELLQLITSNFYSIYINVIGTMECCQDRQKFV